MDDVSSSHFTSNMSSSNHTSNHQKQPSTATKLLSCRRIVAFHAVALSRQHANETDPAISGSNRHSNRHSNRTASSNEAA